MQDKLRFPQYTYVVALEALNTFCPGSFLNIAVTAALRGSRGLVKGCT